MDGSGRPPTQHVQVLGLEANAERNEGSFDGLRRAYRRSRGNPGKGRTGVSDACLGRGRGNAGAAGGVAKSSSGCGARRIPCSSGSSGVDSLCCAAAGVERTRSGWPWTRCVRGGSAQGACGSIGFRVRVGREQDTTRSVFFVLTFFLIF
jgi:hypothetical protein